ncbi:MAG TPA: chromosome partitioning protein ParB, partial [Candidatus Methylomirabilis sp.]
SEGHARALLGLERPADQLNARDVVVKRGLTVRETEALVRRLKGGPPAKPGRLENQDPNLAVLEDQLRAVLGTKVRIVRDGKGGTLQINFFSSDDLTRIVEAIVGTP